MASKHTTHLGLCQWERSDPFTLDDFNADNAKLDAAIGQMAYRVLEQQLPTTDQHVFRFDLSGYDLSQVNRLRVEISGTTYCPGSHTMGIQVGDLSTNYFFTDVNGNTSISSSSVREYITAGTLVGSNNQIPFLWTVDCCIGQGKGMVFFSNFSCVYYSSSGSLSGYQVEKTGGIQSTITREELTNITLGQMSIYPSNVNNVSYLDDVKATLLQVH